MTMAAVAHDVEPNSISVEERETGRDEANNNSATTIMAMSRKEKRKMLKKMKRKQLRREKALKEREEEEARLNDHEEKMKLLRLEQEEAERMERDRREFEVRERRFLQELELKKKRDEEKEEQRRKLLAECQTNLGDNENANGLDEDDDWEYIEEGPAEIIWKGNEIIVKKKTVRVRKKSLDSQNIKQGSDRPISNPLAPQAEAFEDYKSAREVLESVAQQVPNFGTEQDKAHCPFHLKTGVCRFGARCSRVHFYPDKSCTLLMKNMYSGPGLAWEHDEGLEYTDEEVELSFEDFYEDVHTEFLKFGEIVNFKVCKNSSSHLRGNVYVHYKSLESAVLAYQSINGRYFAGKQISCEFVNVMRWRVAICGEYMKSRLKTCSRGSACNFIHCFRNPGGDYEWADWDKPAPRYWLKKMASLFGYTADLFGYTADRLAEEVSPSFGHRKSRSGGPGSAYGKSHSDEDDDWKRERPRRHRGDSRERIVDVEEEMHEGKIYSQRYHCDKHRKMDTADMSDGSSDEQRSFACRKRSRNSGRDSKFTRDSKNRKHESEFDKTESVKKGEDDRYLDRSSGSSRRLDCHSRDKADAFDLKENSHAERHHDKYLRHKSKHSAQRKEDTDLSDVDSYEGRRDREKHRHRSHRKRSSRDMKYDAEYSDNASDRDIGRDGTKHQKNGRRSLSSKNEPDLVDIRSNSGRHRRDQRSHGHRRRSSRHRSSEESGLSNVNSKAYKNYSGGNSPEEKDGLSESHICGNDSKCSSCGIASYEGCHTEDGRRYGVECIPHIYESNKETTASQTVDTGGRQSSSLHICGKSKSELEQAYRLAALKKLEEMKKSQDSQPDHNSEHGDSARNNHDSQSVAVLGEEVSKGLKESPDSSKVETKVVSTKRRRI